MPEKGMTIGGLFVLFACILVGLVIGKQIGVLLKKAGVTLVA